MYRASTTDDAANDTFRTRNEAWLYDALHPHERLHDHFCYRKASDSMAGRVDI